MQGPSVAHAHGNESGDTPHATPSQCPKKPLPSPEQTTVSRGLGLAPKDSTPRAPKPGTSSRAPRKAARGGEWTSQAHGGAFVGCVGMGMASGSSDGIVCGCVCVCVWKKKSQGCVGGCRSGRARRAAPQQLSHVKKTGFPVQNSSCIWSLARGRHGEVLATGARGSVVAVTGHRSQAMKCQGTAGRCRLSKRALWVLAGLRPS